MVTKRVCVIGAGVVGLSSAVCVLEQCPGVEVTILADKFSPHTTSDVAGGVWQPYCLGDTPEDLIKTWSGATWDHLLRLYQSPDAGRAGCQLLSGYIVADVEKQEHDFKDQVLGYRLLTPKELELFPNARWGVFHTTLQVDVTLYLYWLMARFKSQGGRIQQVKLTSLDQVTDRYDVVVNCTGLGSYDLLGDTALNPVRGQVLRFRAPWVKHFYLNLDPPERETYIFPGPRYVVVGGVAQPGNWNPEVDESDSKDIFQRAVSLVPSLKEAKLEFDTAGWRPGRTEVRLERQDMKKQGRTCHVVHNYGHGGAGVTLHWGCAQNVIRLGPGSSHTESQNTRALSDEFTIGTKDIIRLLRS